MDSGPIDGELEETWRRVDNALVYGPRSFRYGGSSLAQLLAKHRGVRNVRRPLPLTEALIARWAAHHHRRTGQWPNENTGPVHGQPGETWVGIDSALAQGCRGLPGRSSLARLLQERRGVRNKDDLPRLTERQIVAWAKAHRKRTGKWPSVRSGPVANVSGENWPAINQALDQGLRGLPGGSSLSQLLRLVKDKSNLVDRRR